MQNETNILSLPKELLIYIISFLTLTQTHVLYMSMSTFKKIAYSPDRTKYLTFKKAIKNKSLSYIEMVEEKKKLHMNIYKYIFHILNTNDKSFICSLLEKYNYSLSKHLCMQHIVSNCSAEINMYIINNNICSEFVFLILSHDRFDIINAYSSKGINLIKYLSPSDYNNIKTLNVDVYKLLYTNEIKPNAHHLTNAIFYGKIELVKWIYDKIEKSDIDFIKKELIFRNIVYIDPLVKIWLHVNEIYSSNDIYETIVLKNLENQIDTSNMDKTMTSRIITHYASKNIFILDNLHLVKTNSKYKTLYYAILFDREDIYKLNIFAEFGDIYKIKQICKLKNETLIYNFLHSQTPYILCIKDLCFLNDIELIDVLLSYAKIDFCDAFKFYKDNKISTFYHIINSDRVHYYSYLSKSDTKIACRSNDSQLISILVSKEIITLELLIKYCTVEIIKSAPIKWTDSITNIAIKYGNTEIIKYAVSKNKSTLQTVQIAHCRSSHLAEWILEQISISNSGSTLT